MGLHGFCLKGFPALHIGAITESGLRRVERKFAGKSANWLARPCVCVYLYIISLLIEIWPDFNTVWLTTVQFAAIGFTTVRFTTL
jgi:hypothetical protein